MRNFLIGTLLVFTFLSACKTNNFTVRKYRSGNYHEKIAHTKKPAKSNQNHANNEFINDKGLAVENQILSSKIKSENQKNYGESLIASSNTKNKNQYKKYSPKTIHQVKPFHSINHFIKSTYALKQATKEKKKDPQLPLSIVSVASAVLSLLFLIMLLLIDPALIPAAVFYIGGLVFGIIAFTCGIMGLSGRKKDKENSTTLSKAFSLSGLIYGALLILAYLIIGLMVLLILALFIAIFS